MKIYLMFVVLFGWIFILGPICLSATSTEMVLGWFFITISMLFYFGNKTYSNITKKENKK